MRLSWIYCNETQARGWMGNIATILDVEGNASTKITHEGAPL